jgi:hypothetical protein
LFEIAVISEIQDSTLLPAGTGTLPLEISRGSPGAKMMTEVMIALKLTDLGITLWAAVVDGLAR